MNDPSLSPRFRAAWRLAAAALFLAAALGAGASEVPLKLERLELVDGRTLTHVVIKSYDAASGRLLLVADGTAMLIPAGLVPAPFGERIKAGAPRAGATMSVVPVAPASGPPPAAAGGVPAAPGAAPAAGGDEAAALADHRQVAEERARRYFEFEYILGSGAVSVTKLDIQTRPPAPVAGWPARYRTRGTAWVEFYESKGRSFGRRSSRFEVVTEQKPDGSVVVAEFTPVLPERPTGISD